MKRCINHLLGYCANSPEGLEGAQAYYDSYGEPMTRETQVPGTCRHDWHECKDHVRATELGTTKEGG